MSAKHDLVIIGGGAGGLVVASVAAQLGLDVVLIDKEEAMGGDCLHFGCVPSKALLKSASVAYQFAQADRWGIKAARPVIDIALVNQSIQNAIETLQVHDSRKRFESLGCDVVTGSAHFTGPTQVSVNAQHFDARRIVIATGSSAFIPPIQGLDKVAYLTNEDMFSLAVLPANMIIIGGGPVGVEMAQAYARLGTQVTIIELASRLIPRMDGSSSRILAEALQAEGVSLYLGSEVVAVTEHDGCKKVALKDGTTLQADELLIAIGRRPVLDNLNLDAAGVHYDVSGIKVNRRMQTSNKKIYACGDVTGEMPLTHVAELQAGIIIANMVFRMPKKVSYDVIPAVVYTQPEVAQVGVSVEQCEALKRGEVHRFEITQLDRAVTDNEAIGQATILTDRGRVVGAHIIAPHAGEMIHELALAIQEKLHISRITSLVHAYPSYSQLNKRLAGQYYTKRLFSPKLKKAVALMNRFLP